MTLDVRATIRGGVDRATSSPALTVVAAVALAQLASSIALQSQLPYLEDALPAGTLSLSNDPRPLALPLSQATITVLALVAAIGTSVVVVVAFRTFSGDSYDRFPPDVGRRLARATAHVFVGQLLFGLLFLLGAVLILPAVFVFVAFGFVPAFVAVEDASVLRAFVDSWALGRGNRFELFVVFFGMLLAAFSFNLVVVDAGSVLLGPSIAFELLRVVVSGLVAVFVMGTVASAFDRLRALEAEADELADIDDELLP